MISLARSRDTRRAMEIRERGFSPGNICPHAYDGCPGARIPETFDTTCVYLEKYVECAGKMQQLRAMAQEMRQVK